MDWATIIMYCICSGLQYIGNQLDKAPMCPPYCEAKHKHYYMKSYKVNGKDCYIYDEGEVPEGITVVDDWRASVEGDWVLTDDGHVIQVLKKWKNLIRTCTGTYHTYRTGKLDTKRSKDIYSISGKSSYQKVLDRKEPTQKEIFFALRAAKGQDPGEAYLEVYDTKNPVTAHKKAAILLKQERIKRIMNQDLKDVFAEQNIDLTYLIARAKDEADNGKTTNERLTALKMLWMAYGVIETVKETTHVGVIQGFDRKLLEEVKRPLEISENPDTGT